MAWWIAGAGMNKIARLVYGNQVRDNGLGPDEAEHVEFTARSVAAAGAMSDPRWPAPEWHV